MQNDHNIASQQYGTVSFWRGPLQLKLLQVSHLLNPALEKCTAKLRGDDRRGWRRWPDMTRMSSLMKLPLKLKWMYVEAR